MRISFLFLFLTASLQATETWTYWIEPCTASMATDSGCRAKDPELAMWALEAWRTASDSQITLSPVSEEQKARLRLRWVSGRAHLYGEARPFLLNGQRGAEVYVLPAVADSQDPLMREAVVYLTCLHELGHALGLAHTRNFADIMYSFQFGGDIPEYFGRYRRTLQKREDIRHSSGISAGDREALKALALP